MSDFQGLKCLVCNIVVNNAHDKEQHANGKKHRLAVHQAHVKRVKESCSIFVKGFPNNVNRDLIVAFLGTFGAVEDCFVGERNSYALVQFKDADTAAKLIQSPPKYNGRTLLVKNRVINDHTLPSADFVGALFAPKIRDNLKNIVELQEQVDYIVDVVQPNANEKMATYNTIIQDLALAMNGIFGCLCRVFPFGSTATGLDFKGSDVDAYVFVPLDFHLPAFERASLYVKKVRKAMDRRLFGNIIAIPNAKTPIIRCIHMKTNVNCDINFKNMLGVCNSALITYYLNQNNRLRSIVLILKLWAKMHDIIGGSNKFSAYSLSMLFIFYLQFSKCVISVFALQTTGSVNLQASWNGGFDGRIIGTPARLASIPGQELLYNFFLFYSKFDYSMNVISPFHGQILSKSCFNNLSSLPYQFRLYKENIARGFDPLMTSSYICLQDPFELNHNTTKGVSKKILDEFVALCSHAATLFHPDVKDPSLHKLFTEEYNQPKCELSDSTCTFKIDVGTCLKYCEQKLNDNTNPSEIRTAWFQSTVEFVKQVVKDVLKLKITSNERKGSKKKSSRMEGQQDVHDSNCDTFSCEGVRNVWEARKGISRDLNIDVNKHKTVLDKQKFISDYICDVLLKDIAASKILAFTVTLRLKAEPTCLEVELKRTFEGQKKLFGMFAQFFVTNLPLWFKTYETELNAATTTKEAEAEVVDLTSDN